MQSDNVLFFLEKYNLLSIWAWYQLIKKIIILYIYNNILLLCCYSYWILKTNYSWTSYICKCTLATNNTFFRYICKLLAISDILIKALLKTEHHDRLLLEIVDILLILRECHNYHAAARLYEIRFPNRRHPSFQAIHAIARLRDLLNAAPHQKYREIHNSRFQDS